MSSIPTERADIVVLGSGIAGLYTALSCYDLGRVVLITKGKLSQSSTELAQGGIAAAVGPGDSPLFHFADTVAAGDGLCREEAVRVMVEEGPDTVRRLMELGVRFEAGLAREAAHSRRRILHWADITGDEIRRGLETALRAVGSVFIREGHFAWDLLVLKGRCLGVTVLDEQDEPYLLLSRATVIATGGAGQLYLYNTNPEVATGDGIAMAYRAGARLEDMEFIQFHPTAFCSPEGHCFLISEAVRGEGAVIVNRKGERFLARYHPAAELAPRDVVARALFREMRETGEPVYIDLRPVEGLSRRFPHICERLRHQGWDPEKVPVPVTPAAHYLMGGVKTDLDGYTGLPGLYACGEAACTGVHGANRLASNSLLEGAVFGARIARALRKFLLPPPSSLPAIPHWGWPRVRPSKPKVREIWRRLQRLMWEKVGLEREGSRLREAYEEIRSLRASLGAPGSREEKELQNLLTVAQAVARAALAREESRGAHFRTDFPRRDDARWLRHLDHRRGKLLIGR